MTETDRYLVLTEFENWLKSKYAGVTPKGEIVVWCYNKTNCPVDIEVLVVDGHYENAISTFLRERN